MPPKANTAGEERLLRTVRDIVERFPGRTSGSDGERGAAAYVLDRFRRQGLPVEQQAVAVTTRQHLPQVLAFSLVVLAGIALSWSAPLAAVLALVGLAGAITEANATPTISRFLPKRTSSNVLAKLAAPAAGVGQRVVIVAHLDVGQPTLFTHPRAALIQRQSFVFAVNAASLVALLGLLGSVSSLAQVWWVGLAAALYLLFHIGVLALGSLNLKPPAGANDDASGLAVLVELPERLRSLERTEVWLLAVAGHEVGLAGMRHFLAQMPDRERVLVVNLESVGAGSINLSLIEGYVRRTPMSRRLLEAAAHVVSEVKLPVRARAYQAEPTEAQLAMRQGVPATSIFGINQRGVVPNWHWPSDTLDGITPASLEITAQLVEGIVRHLDAGPQAPTPTAT